MRIARKIMLLAAMAIAAMAFAAGSASAANPIEIEDLASNPCNPACVVHIDGESHLARLDTGAIITTCADEFSAELNHNGTGPITWTGSAHGAPGCNTTNCVIMSPRWNIASTEEVAAGQVEFLVPICLRSIVTGAESECSVDVIATDLGGGSYHFDAASACPSGVRVELEGQTEPDEGFTIHHL